MTVMNRREAVKAASLLLGGAVAASSGLLGCAKGEPVPKASDTVAATPPALTADESALLEVVADTILPDTPASPGAKAAGCATTMVLLLTDCRTDAEQERLRRGLHELRTRAPDFATRPQPDREAVLHTIDIEAEQATKAGTPHWFPLARDLAYHSYFSSETGATQALRYVMEPGGFTGCVPLQPGQPAWA